MSYYSGTVTALELLHIIVIPFSAWYTADLKWELCNQIQLSKKEKVCYRMADRHMPSPPLESLTGTTVRPQQWRLCTLSFRVRHLPDYSVPVVEITPARAYGLGVGRGFDFLKDQQERDLGENGALPCSNCDGVCGLYTMC